MFSPEETESDVSAIMDALNVWDYYVQSDLTPQEKRNVQRMALMSIQQFTEPYLYMEIGVTAGMTPLRGKLDTKPAHVIIAFSREKGASVVRVERTSRDMVHIASTAVAFQDGKRVNVARLTRDGNVYFVKSWNLRSSYMARKASR